MSSNNYNKNIIFTIEDSNTSTLNISNKDNFTSLPFDDNSNNLFSSENNQNNTNANYSLTELLKQCLVKLQKCENDIEELKKKTQNQDNFISSANNLCDKCNLIMTVLTFIPFFLFIIFGCVIYYLGIDKQFPILGAILWLVTIASLVLTIFSFLNSKNKF